MFPALLLALCIGAEILLRDLSVVILVLFVLVAGLAASAAWVLRVTLYLDAIEMHGIQGTRRLAISEIEGYRTFGALGAKPSIRLVPVKRLAREMELPAHLDIDESFKEWLARIPDLDARDQRNAMEMLVADTEVPGSPDQKLQQLEQARRIARGLGLALIATSVAYIFRPQLLGFLLLPVAVFPWAALYMAARHGAFYRLNPADGDGRASLLVLLIFSPGALLLSCLQIDMLDPWKLAAYAVVAGTLWLAVSLGWIAELRSNPKSLVVVLGCLLVYSYAGLGLVNKFADGSVPESFTVPAQQGSEPSEPGWMRSRFAPVGFGRQRNPAIGRQGAVCQHKRGSNYLRAAVARRAGCAPV